MAFEKPTDLDVPVIHGMIRKQRLCKEDACVARQRMYPIQESKCGFRGVQLDEELSLNSILYPLSIQPARMFLEVTASRTSGAGRGVRMDRKGVPANLASLVE
jgi:hypothetical protein